MVCADGLEQQDLRGMVSCGGFYHCARCLSKGMKKSRTGVYIPLRDISPTERTHQMFVNRFEQQGDTLETSVGIERRSPLLDIPGFDIVDQVSMDAMHTCHLGVTDKTWNLIRKTSLDKVHETISMLTSVASKNS